MVSTHLFLMGGHKVFVFSYFVFDFCALLVLIVLILPGIIIRPILNLKLHPEFSLGGLQCRGRSSWGNTIVVSCDAEYEGVCPYKAHI